MLSRCALVGTLVILAGGLSTGCAGSDRAGGPSRPPTTASVPSGGLSARTSDAARPGALDVRGQWTWRVLRRGIPPTRDEVFAFDGRFLVESASDDARTVQVTDRRTGRVVLTHQTVTGGAKWHVQDAFLAYPWLVLVEAPVDGGGDPATRPFAYDLRSGHRRDVLAGAVPTPAAPEPYDADDRAMTYSSRANGRSCLAVVDLASLKGRTVSCAPRAWLIGNPVLNGHVLAGMLRATTGHPCARGITVDLNQRPPRTTPMAAVKHCANYGLAATADFSVAVEIPVGAEDLTQAEAFGSVAGQEPVRLGSAISATATICGSWAYWETSDPGTQRFEVRRWRPGADVQIVYRNPSEGWFTTSGLQCDGGWLRLMRSWTGGGRERGQQLLAAHAVG